MNNEIILLKQLPIISYDKMKEVGEQVQKRIADLDLENQVITEQTKQSAKNTRADLNKEFKVFEEQRKMIKEKVLEPLNEFEENYKGFIANHYQNADNILKTKINQFEQRLKDEKEQRVKSYFSELCQANDIDFLSWEKMYINVTLSSSENQLMKKIEEKVTAVAKDITTIKSIPKDEDYKTEVLVEYKKAFDLPKSFEIVNKRIEDKAKELARIETQKQAQAERQAKLQAEQEAEPKEVLQAPKEVKQEPKKAEIFETSFKVRGTKEQLIALKQFIINNNIEIL